MSAVARSLHPRRSAAIAAPAILALAAGATLSAAGSSAVLFTGLVTGAIGAVLVTWSFRLFPLLVVLGVALLLPDRTVAQIGLPSVGLNLMDMTVLFLVPWVIADRLMLGAARPEKAIIDPVLRPLVAFFAIGTVFLLVGLLHGAAIRSALRDYRPFVYIPVLYAYTRTACRHGGLGRLTVAWALLSATELVALGTGLLVPIPEPGTALSALPTSAPTSAWHFLGVWSFVPLYLAVAYLGGGRLGPGRLTAAAVATIALSVVIAALSFNRTVWTVLPLSLWSGALILRSRGLPQLGAVGWTLVPALVLALAVASLMIPNLSGALAVRASSTVQQRDPAIASRIVDSTITIGRIAQNPVGHGLGVGELAGNQVLFNGSYRVGSALHNGYIWLGYNVGLVGLAIFVRILWLALRRLRSITHAVSVGRSMIAMAVAAMLVGLMLSAAFGPTLLNYTSIPYWGLVLGMLAALGAAERVSPELPVR